MFREYPVLEPWFSQTDNMAAQLFEDQRLMSAQEKIGLFGGHNQVRETLTRKWFFNRRSSALLMACRDEPMIEFEVTIFELATGLKIDKLATAFTMDSLLDHNLLGITAGLTYVIRSPDSNGFIIAENQLGFLTSKHSFLHKL